MLKERWGRIHQGSTLKVAAGFTLNGWYAMRQLLMMSKLRMMNLLMIVGLIALTMIADNDDCDLKLLMMVELIALTMVADNDDGR